MQFSRLDKIFVVFSAVFIAVMAAAGYFLEVRMKQKLTEHIRGDSLVIARTIARALPETEPMKGLDDLCSIYRRDTGLRITIIAADGRVEGESHRPSNGMENHRDRPEIRDALSSGHGWAVRHSQTLNQDMAYAAVLTPGKNRVVRVAMPLNQLRHVKNEIMLLASIFLYLLPFLAALMLFFLARYLKRTAPPRAL
jgi:two-component system phosphate regulon sensor histidine kinase PhoR